MAARDGRTEKSGGHARAHVSISGLVQGVCFRWATADEAARLGVTGWVRNRPDASVEGVFEGARDRVEALLRWCHRGPPAARVERVTVEWETPTGEFRNFGIRR